MTNTLTHPDATPSTRAFDPPLEQLAGRVTGPVLAGTDPCVPQEVATFNLAVTHRPTVVVGQPAQQPAEIEPTPRGLRALPQQDESQVASGG